eukprot:8661108-Alexandrium_andersonii.AAC.1
MRKAPAEVRTAAAWHDDATQRSPARPRAVAFVEVRNAGLRDPPLRTLRCRPNKGAACQHPGLSCR